MNEGSLTISRIFLGKKKWIYCNKYDKDGNNLRNKINSYLFFSTRKNKGHYKLQECRIGRVVQGSHEQSLLCWKTVWIGDRHALRLPWTFCTSLLCLQSFVSESAHPRLKSHTHSPSLPFSRHVLQALPVRCTLVRLWFKGRSCEDVSTTFWQGVGRDTVQGEKKHKFKLQAPRIHRCTLVTVCLGGSSGASLNCFRDIISQCSSLYCL